MTPTERVARRLTGWLGEQLGVEARALNATIRGDQAWIGLSDRFLLQLQMTEAGGELSWRPAEGGRWVSRTLEDLDHPEHLPPEIGEAVVAWASRLTPYRLVPGRRYRIARSFTDHYHGEFAAGEILTFRQKSFLPYDNGYTLHFEERSLFFTGDEEIYSDFGLLVVEDD